MHSGNKKFLALLVVGALGLTAPSIRAEEQDGLSFRGSGFLTLAAGAVLNNGPAQNASGYHCPCFISDYGEAGVYEKGGLHWRPDSKLGLQGSALYGRYSVTTQVVWRGVDSVFDMEWLYGDIKLNNNLTLQAGRKRLPLFYYSESQDVGFAIPWAHLPPQLYGWEIINYNGANLLYKDQWGDWSSGMNVFGGNENLKDSPYWKLYNGKNSRTDSHWSNIAGAYFTLGNEWLEGRLLYVQSDIQNTILAPVLQASPTTRQKIYGASFNIDYSQWVVRSEFLYINRKESYGGDHAELLGAGYRLGKWLPMATYARYRQSVTLDQTMAEAHDGISLLLRYDLTTSSDVKVQFDHWKNRAQAPFFAATPATANPVGQANLLTLSYDMVF
ncbi:MAG TPA: hypothetical protein VIU46_08770 [Gallionellaceae bacterium]